MTDPIDGPEQSIAFYVAAERASGAAPPTEAGLTTWAMLALLLVLSAIAIGGCS